MCYLEREFERGVLGALCSIYHESLDFPTIRKVVTVYLYACSNVSFHLSVLALRSIYRQAEWGSRKVTSIPNKSRFLASSLHFGRNSLHISR